LIVRRASIGAIALAAVAVSCARDEEPRPAQPLAQSPAKATVKINLNPNLGYAPIVIAMEEGFFADENVEISPQTIDSNQAMLAITTGDLDVLSSPVRAGLFNMMARGVNLQIVADRGHSRRDGCNAEAFLAPVATAERVARRGTFKGEKFALIRGGNTEYLIERVLETNGLTRADIELVQLPQGDMISSVGRRIDAIRYTVEPHLSRLVGEGTMKVVVEMEQIAPGNQLSVIVFGPRLLETEPEVGRRFIRAYLRGVRRYNEGKTDRNVAIIAKHTKLPQEMIRRACWQTMSSDGHIDPEAMQPFLTWARKVGYIEADVPVARWWNPSYVEAATRSAASAAR
jgi:NitT/TauT family transport system substrate-binding protein